MNILMVYQSVVDTCASVFMLLHAVIKVESAHLSRNSSYDQFVCFVWLRKQPFWYFMTESTYGILFTALDRYVAVLHPLWYKNNVRVLSLSANVSIFQYFCIASWANIELFQYLCTSNSHRFPCLSFARQTWQTWDVSNYIAALYCQILVVATIFH